MSRGPEPDATELLALVAQGSDDAGQELLALLYGELRALAQRHMRGQHQAHTLQPTALVHEAWLKLVGGDSAHFRDRGHFLAFASRAMRSVLVDSARARDSAKRGGGVERVPLDSTIAEYEQSGVELLELDDALLRLADQEPELVAVVELRFFGGLTMEDVAEVLDVSLSTAERRWRMARIWLRSELGGDGAGDAS